MTEGMAGSSTSSQRSWENSLLSNGKQSSVTVQKILQHLDKSAPSPKANSCELKATTVMDASPSKLTHGDNHVIGARGLTSQKPARVVENGPTKISVSEDKLGPEANEAVTARSTRDTTSSVKTANAVISCSVENFPQKKQAWEKSENKECMERGNKEELEDKENEKMKSNTCYKCSASFRKPAYLKQHMQSHSIESLRKEEEKTKKKGKGKKGEEEQERKPPPIVPPK